MTDQAPDTAADPLRELAQAILDGRVALRTEFYETRDGDNIAWTEIKVSNADT